MTSLTRDPIDRQPTYERVAERLIGLITRRALAPGAPLPTERELADAYGVGRSSVREALRMLESQGVIAPGPGNGFTVAAPARPLHRSLRLVMSLDAAPGPGDVLELRRILEVEAAGLAAERRSAADLARMDRATDDMRDRRGAARVAS